MYMTLDQFGPEVPKWYEKYQNKCGYYPGYCCLLERLPKKAKRLGHLELEDLQDIADWGGNQHNVRKNLTEGNKPSDVRKRTGEAILCFDDPRRAILAVTRLHGWNLTYGSKTLMFMNPWKYVALDSHIREGLQPYFSNIGIGQYSAPGIAYPAFLAICRDLQCKVNTPVPDPGPAYPNYPPNPNGPWLLADIQQAIFEFARDGNCIVP